MDEGPWTLYELKEFLVEWGARSWSPASISNTISPNNLISMSMLDSSILEEGVPLYSGPDLDISLRHDMSGATRQEWLLTTIRGGLRDLNARSAVDRLLDEDLRAAGDFSLIGQPQSYDHKVSWRVGFLSVQIMLTFNPYRPKRSLAIVSRRTYHSCSSRVILWRLEGSRSSRRCSGVSSVAMVDVSVIPTFFSITALPFHSFRSFCVMPLSSPPFHPSVLSSKTTIRKKQVLK